MGHSTILVGIDFSPLGEMALAGAAALARSLKVEHLHLVHIAEAFPLVPVAGFGFTPEAVGMAIDAELDEAKKKLAGVKVPGFEGKVTHEVRMGPPAPELAAAAAKARADVLVVASHDRSTLGRIVVGSVASSLLRISPCPVMIVGKDRPWRSAIKTVLAGVDLSPVSGAVIAEATELAAAAGASLRLVSCFRVPRLLPETGGATSAAEKPIDERFAAAYRERLEEMVKQYHRPNQDVQVDVVNELPAHEVLLRKAKTVSADLVIIGTSGHNVLERALLGSTAHRVVIEAGCPVLVVPSSATDAVLTAAAPETNRRSV
ncbi:MAG: universal stress protein [Myxococcota bacterium]